MNERYQEIVKQAKTAQKLWQEQGSIVPSAGELDPREENDLTRTDREAELDLLAQKIDRCKRCRLGELRQRRKQETRYTHRRQGKAVPGEGPVNALVFAIGDRPGREEDETGKPIVGRTSAVFEQILDFLGLDRDDVFVSNVVKCSPPNVREPTKTEWCICTSNFLHRQIKLVRPKLILVFGSVTFDALMQSPDEPQTKAVDCRTEYTSHKTFDSLYGNRLLDYPLDPSIKVWWTRHYAALARDQRERVRYAAAIAPLRRTIHEYLHG